jgi:hypothetical protein
MIYCAKRTVNLGDGHLLQPGQTANLAEGISIPGLEPVLEREPAVGTLERQGAERSLDAPARGRLIT